MPSVDPAILAADVKERASDVGFDAVRITSPSLPITAGIALDAFLNAGRHGDMAWMEERTEQRRSPQSLWPDVQSVIVLGVNYGPDCDPMDKLSQRQDGNISVYAQGRDYHDVVKKKLKRLARNIVDAYGAEVKVFVDTAPVMEKPLAAQSGLGWQGKHTNLVSREFGSWLFIGSIFTTLNLAPDPPEVDNCGSCRNCLDACPTDAFPAPYELDARRCISYLTIEHKGHIPVEFRSAIGNRIYGCDDCLAVCPWNKFAEIASDAKLHAREGLQGLALATLASLDDPAFRELFSGSPIKRTGRDRFVRNVLIAIGNADDEASATAIEPRLNDASPLVRAAAVWAASRRLGRERIVRLAESFADGEDDPQVTQEWRDAVSS